MKRLLFLLMFVFLASGLSAQQREKIEYQESSARNLEPEHLMLLTPLIADLEVSQNKVTHVEVDAFASIPVTTDVIKSMPEFKKIALSRAARACNADVMVGTTIDVVTNSKGFIEITVTGYPAFYRNFRIADTTDLKVVEYARSIEEDNENAQVVEKPQTNTTYKNKETR